jgi:hypothetical protein
MAIITIKPKDVVGTLDFKFVLRPKLEKALKELADKIKKEKEKHDRHSEE